MKMYILNIENELIGIVKEKSTSYIKEQINNYMGKKVLDNFHSHTQTKYIALRFKNDIDYFEMKMIAVKNQISLKQLLNNIIRGKIK